MKRFFRLLPLFFSLVLFGCFDKGAPRARQTHAAVARPKVWASINKVITVVLENTDFERAVNQPFMKRLAQEGALLNNYYAITHPSQPNYIALISGSIHGVDHNDN